MNINYIKSILNLFGKHLICTLGCLLFIMVFPSMVESGFTQIIYSVVAIMIYFDFLFTCAWNIGNKHRKAINSYNRRTENKQNVKYNYKSGLVLSVILGVINLVICLVCFILSCSENPWLSVCGNLIYKFWFAEFIVLFKYIVRLQYLLWFIIALFPSVSSLLGYICGVKDANYFEIFVKRLVYKKTK